MKNSPKMAILQSLDAMDQMQMEEVLKYIKGILDPSTGNGYKAFKKEAMKEIRQALKKGKNGFQLSA
jgi:repressor of nif and glnA expression